MCYGTCKYQNYDGECTEELPKPFDGDCMEEERLPNTGDFDGDFEDYEEL